MIMFAFQSTYLYKVRHNRRAYPKPIKCFNPRTYIRYDNRQNLHSAFFRFQSTYLYKVRQKERESRSCLKSFNPRTYIRYDNCIVNLLRHYRCFNPRTYIRYDLCWQRTLHPPYQFQSTYLYKVRQQQCITVSGEDGFNPRTYIRYDCSSFYYINI